MPLDLSANMRNVAFRSMATNEAELLEGLAGSCNIFQMTYFMHMISALRVYRQMFENQPAEIDVEAYYCALSKVLGLNQRAYGETAVPMEARAHTYKLMRDLVPTYTVQEAKIAEHKVEPRKKRVKRTIVLSDGEE